MVQISDKLISLDVFERRFWCNLDLCRGKCCVHGDSGAPLSEDETRILDEQYERFCSYISEKGDRTVRMNGKWLVDKDGDRVTPLIDWQECAYAVFDDGIARCGIEKAWIEGKTTFRKPVSCHLYPIRVSRVGGFIALNYHQWSVCQPALDLGSLKGIPLYVFLREAIIRAFGNDFYEEMDKVAGQLKDIHTG